MAHMWIQLEKAAGSPKSWAIALLSDKAGAYALTGRPEKPIQTVKKPKNVKKPLIVLGQGQGPDAWVLVSSRPKDVRINGLPLFSGIRCLQDQDEIQAAPGRRLFFSTERQAHTEPFPGMDRPVSCARCRQVLDKGSPAVQCPQCGVWHHQMEDLLCWTYGDHCAMCRQPTSFDAGFQWTPEGL